jgi:hypothetical protein
MHIAFTSIVYVFIFSVVALNSQASQLGFYFNSEINSPAINFNADSSHWSSSGTGNYGYGEVRLGSWFSLSDSIKFGAEKRLSHYLTFTPETAEFYGRLESKDIPAGNYPLSLRINSAKSNALFMKYTLYPTQKLTVEVAVYFLKGVETQQAVITGLGEVTVDPITNEETYSYRYDLDYFYGQNELIKTVFGPPTVSAKGYGHSFDISMAYLISNNLAASFTLANAFHLLYWSQVNYDSGCVARPSSCLLSETQTKSQRQSLPYAVNASLRYDFDNGPKGFSADIEAVKLARHESIWLGLNAWGLGGYFDTLNETLKLSYESERLAVKWAFDDVNFNRANHWQITLGASWPVL